MGLFFKPYQKMVLVKFDQYEIVDLMSSASIFTIEMHHPILHHHHHTRLFYFVVVINSLSSLWEAVKSRPPNANFSNSISLRHTNCFLGESLEEEEALLRVDAELLLLLVKLLLLVSSVSWVLDHQSDKANSSVKCAARTVYGIRKWLFSSLQT